MESKNGAVSVASNVPSKPQVRSNVMCVIKWYTYVHVIYIVILNCSLLEYYSDYLFL
jgi:hypothetical protein